MARRGLRRRLERFGGLKVMMTGTGASKGRRRKMTSPSPCWSQWRCRTADFPGKKDPRICPAFFVFTTDIFLFLLVFFTGRVVLLV